MLKCLETAYLWMQTCIRFMRTVKKECEFVERYYSWRQYWGELLLDSFERNILKNGCIVAGGSLLANQKCEVKNAIVSSKKNVLRENIEWSL